MYIFLLKKQQNHHETFFYQAWVTSIYLEGGNGIPPEIYHSMNICQYIVSTYHMPGIYHMWGMDQCLHLQYFCYNEQRTDYQQILKLNLHVIT